MGQHIHSIARGRHENINGQIKKSNILSTPNKVLILNHRYRPNKHYLGNKSFQINNDDNFNPL